jgi:hypothetical protein
MTVPDYSTARVQAELAAFVDGRAHAHDNEASDITRPRGASDL